MPSPGHIALVTGLVSTSYFTFGNIGAAYFGIMPLTARGQTTLSVPDRLALWDTFYSVSKFHMASSTIIAGLSLSVSSYLTPAGSLRNLLAAGAVSGFTVAIFTVLFILPLNNGLLAISRANSGKPMEEKQQQYVLAQLDQWRALHRVRMALGIISWLASTTALLASDPVIQF